MTQLITLSINGKQQALYVDPQTPLLYVLPEMDYSSAKYGCGFTQCGACKVLIDGEAVATCQLPVGEVADKEIITLEGLSADDKLHPIQQAILDQQAAQCGYCTTGMIIGAVAFCQQQDTPSDEQVGDAMERHLCRCGVYDRVRRAIRSVVDEMPVSPNYEVREMPPLSIAEEAVNLSRSLQLQPDIDAWLRVEETGIVTIFSGKVELGQGITTALAQIAAEELDFPVERIVVQTGDTSKTPYEGGTTGSMSIEMSGGSIQYAAAAARYLMMQMAFEELEAASIDDLHTENGVITDIVQQKSVTYGDLMGGKRFGHTVTGDIQPKHPDEHTLIGKAIPRTDLRSKVIGQPSFIHDFAHPAEYHARVLRPPDYHARLQSIDVEAITALDGVTHLIQDGSFVAIAGDNERLIVQAWHDAQQHITWQQTKALPDPKTLYDDLISGDATSNLIVDGAGTDDPIPEIAISANAVHTLSSNYRRPYQMHGSLAPSAARASWDGDTLNVWSHSQSVFTLRDALMQVLNLPEDKIVVSHVQGAGCYGHNGADDVALDAALIARTMPHQSVLVKWMREQEHAWEPYGSAMAMDVQASLDDGGQIIDWHYDVWSYGHSTRPRGEGETSGLLAAWHLEDPFAQQQPRSINGYHFGAHRNADPLYSLPRKRIVRHDVPDSPLRVSALRSLGAYANIFAIESFMDELAHAAQVDPLTFRLNHLTDERAKAVLEAVAEKSGWYARDNGKEDNTGWGIAIAQYKNRQTYAAIVVNVHVNLETGKIRVLRGYIAADAGRIINPDGLSNQLEGGFVQATSWTLHEQVIYAADGISSTDWDSYPILRFPDAPVVETVLLNRHDRRSVGAGEATQNPTPAAIANAVYDAIGIRLREIPFTPDTVVKQLQRRDG